MVQDSVLILIKNRLTPYVPFDLAWMEVVAEEIDAFRKRFSWRRAGERLFELAVSLAVLYIFWDALAPFRQFAWGITVFFAKLELELSLMFLPFTLFFGAFEVFAVLARFFRKPTKKRFRIAWHSTWVYALLWGIYYVNERYQEQIKLFIERS